MEDPNDNLERSESKETVTTPFSRIQNTGENPVKQNKVNHTYKETTNSIDWGKEYIARMRAAMEEVLSRPRIGIHVSDLVLCNRLRVFRELDPLPIDAKTVGIFIAGAAMHGAAQWLFLHDRKRFEREKHLEFRGISGSVDIYDRIRQIPLEFKTTRASNIMKPKPWHVQQLKNYMAMLGASQGYMMYQLLMHFGNIPFRAFKITMNANERKEQLDKLVEDAESLRIAIESKDPSLAKPVYADPTLNWLCRECPYKVNCKRMQDAAAAA